MKFLYLSVILINKYGAMLLEAILLQYLSKIITTVSWVAVYMVIVTVNFMNLTHSGMVVGVQLVMIVALHLEHHGSTATSLNLRVELLK